MPYIRSVLNKLSFTILFKQFDYEVGIPALRGMWSAFHEKHNFVLFNPFVNDELCVFFGDFDLLSAFACALLAEGEAGKE